MLGPCPGEGKKFIQGGWETGRQQVGSPKIGNYILKDFRIARLHEFHSVNCFSTGWWPQGAGGYFKFTICILYNYYIYTKFYYTIYIYLGQLVVDFASASYELQLHKRWEGTRREHFVSLYMYWVRLSYSVIMTWIMDYQSEGSERLNGA